ncbi:MAG TPA: succinylglutamate desuccinylase/aspartoacylase family protein [Vicinamibacterales bacterium]|nr:succinylglutamate desuccinylase/aspartoacylase family protein [Vicinamibacterales bacterium]
MDVRPSPFSIGALAVASGSTASGAFEVPARPGDPGAPIPFTVVHGTSAGPVLALIAGVHGMEYVPILALQRLRTAISPAGLRGTVVMVHTANVPSFLGRTIYYSPVDHQNLNRVFPGAPDGTLSERIAHTITREVIDRATHVIDLHGGDGNESLRPYAYWITTGDPGVAAASRALALAFGLDRIVVDTERPTDPAASMYLSNTAITRGKPAITTETGGLGGTDPEAIALVERGVAGVLRHLGMHDEGPAPLERPIWLTRHVVLRAGATGLFYAAVECGQRVQAGARLGQVTDFHGQTIEEVRAPIAGEVLYVVRTPPVTRAEPLAMVASADASA